MEETLEGGQGPPRAVALLERERDREYICRPMCGWWGLRNQYSDCAMGCTVQASNPGRREIFFLL
jgi:hypothetical protein